MEQLQNASYDQGGQNFGDGGGGHVIKMRGMPFSATEQDIIDFLEGRGNLVFSKLFGMLEREFPGSRLWFQN